MGEGVEAEADWEHLGTPETYLGYGRGERFASQRVAAVSTSPADTARPCPSRSTPGRSEASGRSGRRTSRCAGRREDRIRLPGARRAPRPPPASGAVPFRVPLDGAPPGSSHGDDVDAHGNGVLHDGRLYQLVRQHEEIRERTLEIAFAAPGAEAYVFTFG